MKDKGIKYLSIATGKTQDALRKIRSQRSYPSRQTAMQLEMATGISKEQWIFPEEHDPWKLLSENWDEYEPRILAACLERVSSENNKITEASNGKE